MVKLAGLKPSKDRTTTVADGVCLLGISVPFYGWFGWEAGLLVLLLGGLAVSFLVAD